MTFCQFTKRFLDVTFRLAAYDIKSGKKKRKKTHTNKEPSTYTIHPHARKLLTTRRKMITQ